MNHCLSDNKHTRFILLPYINQTETWARNKIKDPSSHHNLHISMVSIFPCHYK
eukprot:c2192_g1_i2 orf=425-583(+)